MSEPDPSDAVEETSTPDGYGDTADEFDASGDVAALESRVAELAGRVDEDVEDLRERLVRIYRDVETKADADHTHPETAGRIDDLADDLATIDETTTQLDETLDTVTEQVNEVAAETDSTAESIVSATDRLDDVESRVEELADANDDAMDKLSRVASAVVRTQRRVRVMAHERSERERLDDILTEANRHGIRKARCDGCGNGVRLSLLSKPECPYCESRVDGFEPGRRFIGTSRLLVDDTPALEGSVAATADGNGSPGEPTGDEPMDRSTADEREDDRSDDPAGPAVSARDAGAGDPGGSDAEDTR